MRFRDILDEVDKTKRKDKYSYAVELYLKEIQIKNTPMYYEKIVFGDIIKLFDTKIIKSLDKNYDSYIIVKNNNKTKDLQEEYPESMVISIYDIINSSKDVKDIREYLKIKNYTGSLFRVIYRHIYNDKENFKIKKDVLEKGYVIFEIKDLTDSTSNFRNRYANKNYPMFKDNTEHSINKIYGLIDSYRKYEKTGVFKEEDSKDYKYTKFISKETEAEIMLYKKFIQEFDMFVLTKHWMYTSDKLYIFKNDEDKDSIYSKTPEMEPNYITIENALNVLLEDSDINKILDVKKYIYPCWRIALEHFDNQGWNYNIVEENDKYILIKSFL